MEALLKKEQIREMFLNLLFFSEFFLLLIILRKNEISKAG